MSTRGRRLPAWAWLLPLAVLLLGCTQDDGVTIEMGDNWFEPERLTVEAGEPVTFDNIGQVTHNAIDVEGAWATSEVVASGEAETVTIDEPGTYTFYCSLHAPEDASAGMVGTLTVRGEGTEEEAEDDRAAASDVEPVEPAGEIRRVPDEFPTIQSGVDAAEPGDLVLVDPGVYREQVSVTTEQVVVRGVDRNEVVIDGEFEREMGVVVTADGVALENMTVREVTSNGFYWDGVTGFRGSHLTSINSGTYGIYAFDSSDGVFEHSYVSGSADGGFYVGQCEDCRTILNEVTAEHNAFGFSGTNSSNSLYLVNSTWSRNGAGIVPNTLDSQRHAPSRGVTIAGNLVEANGNFDAPTVRITWPAFGNGIMLAGGVDHEVRDNVVRDHPGYGIAVTPNIDQNLWQAGGNQVRDNVIEGSERAGLAMLAPSGGGDCFADNRVERTLPPRLTQARPCQGTAVPSLGSYRQTLNMLGQLAQFPGDRLPEDIADELPEPGELEQLPGGAQAEVAPAVDVFDGYEGVDLDALTRPEVEGSPERDGALLLAGLPVTQMGGWQAYFTLGGWLLPLAALVAMPVVATVGVLRREDLTSQVRGLWVAVLLVPALLLLVTGWPVAALLTLGVGIVGLVRAARGLTRRARWGVLGGALGTVLIVAPGLVVAGALVAGVL